MTTRATIPIFCPGLLYRDADAAMRWLADVLGCEPRKDTATTTATWSTRRWPSRARS